MTSRRDLLRPIIGNLGMPGKDPTGRGGNLDGGLGGAPVAFSASATLAAGARSIPLNQQTLQPGYRTAYFIDEIRMSVYTSTLLGTDVLPSARRTGVLGMLSARFQTGVHALSQDAVPLGLYAPCFSKFDWGSQIVGEPVAGNYSQTIYGHVRWALPKPLYMGPGDALQCNLDRDAARLSTVTSMTVQVTYVGRIITQGTPPPATRAVPWVGWFEKSSTQAQVQAQTRMRNPFMEPLHVQRLTMRGYWRDATSNYFAPVVAQYGLMPSSIIGAPNTYERIEFSDSLGYRMTRGSVVGGMSGAPPPVGVVFDPSRLAWTFGRPLAAREQFNAVVSNLVPTTDVTNEVVTQYGMVGYREEVA